MQQLCHVANIFLTRQAVYTAHNYTLFQLIEYLECLYQPADKIIKLP